MKKWVSLLKEHSEFSLGTKTKWELVRYIAKLEKNINRAIKLLDKASGSEVGKAIQILRGVK